MYMLIISENIPKDVGYLNAEVHGWGDQNLPLISNYEVVVLDTKFNSSTNKFGHIFSNINYDINKLLNSGGVVICLTYEVATTGDEVEVLRLSSHKPPLIERTGARRYETNYDWLSFKILEKTKLNYKSRIGHRYDLLKNVEIFKNYFEYAKVFHKVIEGGVYFNKENKWKIHLYDYFEQYQIHYKVWRDMDVIAINPVTNEAIACAIFLPRGTLVFLPQSRHSPSNKAYYLFQIGKYYYELSSEKIGIFPKAPEWITNYKTEHEKIIETEISQLEENLKEKYEHRNHFQRINALLFASGNALENATKLAFEDFNLHVEKTKTGDKKDLIVEISSDKRLLIEVTGILDKIKQSSSKMGQMMLLINEKEVNDKIVLIANTYRELEPKDREGKEHFTKEVIIIAENNEICLMTTVDLFNLWKDVIENNKTPEHVIDSIIDTNGVYKLP